LSSTIQGFLDNKKEQITFNTINDALIAVQIAGTILGTVPEPHTMAIGKTLDKTAKAGQEVLKLSEMIYNEKQLESAWNTTIEAMNNPRDRAIGLKALRLNPTLGMHAIAWAAMEKQPADPIAKMVLNSLGLDEKTLASGGSEKKVREYMETLLYEDRKLLSPSMLRVDWAPEKVELKGKDWATVTIRAARDATPLLKKTDEDKILGLLRKTDSHNVEDLIAREKTKTLELKEIDARVKEAEALFDGYRSYRPVAADGSTQMDMMSLAAQFQSLAQEHLGKLRTIQGMVQKAQVKTDTETGVGA
jgi:hypothetical protein